MSAPRIPDTNTITSVDLQWLMDRIRAFKDAYKSPLGYSKNIDKLCNVVSVLDNRVRAALTAAIADKQSFKDTDGFKIIKDAFIELTKALEAEWGAYSLDYQTFPTSKGHSYHKMLASTLSAIYNDYPSIRSSLELRNSNTTGSLDNSTRSSIQFDLNKIEAQSLYNLAVSPRAELDSRIRMARLKENIDVDQGSWAAGKLPVPIRQDQARDKESETKESSDSASNPLDETIKLRVSLRAALESKKDFFGNKAENNEESEKYKAKKNAKVDLITAILERYFQTNDPKVIKMQIDSIRKSAEFKPLIKSSSTTKAFFASFGAKSDMEKLFIDYDKRLDTLIAKKPTAVPELGKTS